MSTTHTGLHSFCCSPANGAAVSSDEGSSGEDVDGDAAAAAGATAGARPRRSAAHADQQPDLDGGASDGFPMEAAVPPGDDAAAAAGADDAPGQPAQQPLPTGAVQFSLFISDLVGTNAFHSTGNVLQQADTHVVICPWSCPTWDAGTSMVQA
jgi:hypothetical protein